MGTGWSQEESVELAVEGPKKLPKKLPHNYQAIINEADTTLPDEPSRLYDQLQCGVFLNKKKKKYWIEEKTGYNCFMLFARGLSITWADDRRYWSWFSIKESSDVDVDVAKLLDVGWLEVQGILDTSNLSPNTSYEVAFVVMMKDPAYGWEIPVTPKASMPGWKCARTEGKTERKAQRTMDGAPWRGVPNIIGQRWTNTVYTVELSQPMEKRTCCQRSCDSAQEFTVKVYVIHFEYIQ